MYLNVTLRCVMIVVVMTNLLILICISLCGSIKLCALHSSKRGVLTQNASYDYNLIAYRIIHDVSLGAP